MSVIDDTPYTRCDGCDLMAFQPSPCAGCVEDSGKHLRFGAGCSSVCEDCGEIFCHEHKDPTKGSCNSCRTAQAIASGDARQEWKWARGC